MSARLVLYWTATVIVASIAGFLATIPFPPDAAGNVGAVVTGAVCFIAIACAPSGGQR